MRCRSVVLGHHSETQVGWRAWSTGSAGAAIAAHRYPARSVNRSVALGPTTPRRTLLKAASHSVGRGAPNDAEALSVGRTSAVVVVDVAGEPNDMPRRRTATPIIPTRWCGDDRRSAGAVGARAIRDAPQ